MGKIIKGLSPKEALCYGQFCKDYKKMLETKSDSKGWILKSIVMDWCIEYCENNGVLLMEAFLEASMNPNAMYALCKMNGNKEMLAKILGIETDKLWK